MIKSTLFYFPLFSLFFLPSFFCTAPDNPFLDNSKVNLAVGLSQKKNGFKWCMSDTIIIKVTITFPHLVSKIVVDYGDNSEKETFRINTGSVEPMTLTSKKKYSEKGQKNIEFAIYMKDGGTQRYTTFSFELGVFPTIHNMGNLKILGDVKINKNVSLIVEHEKFGKASYLWLKDGFALPESNKDYLTLNNLKEKDAGTYSCMVITEWGADTSKEYVLYLISPPIITQQPIDKHVIVGQIALFKISATGQKLSYQWQKDGKSINGAVSPIFETKPVQITDKGLFHCIVSNRAGIVESKKAELKVFTTVIPVKIITHPENQEVTIGEIANFSIKAEGTDLHFQWYENATKIVNATEEQMLFGPVKKSDNGKLFSCIASNTAGEKESKKATLRVKPPLKPVIIKQPLPVKVLVGETATFIVVAEGKDLQYQWWSNGEKIPNATKLLYEIQSTALSDNGKKINCVISNSGGEITSDEVLLTVIKEEDKPEITFHPQDQTVTSGDNATFGIFANGSNLQYQWQKNRVDLPGETRTIIKLYAITMEEDRSSYRCIVSNEHGSVTSNEATLTVE